jgi:hypothetical protein
MYTDILKPEHAQIWRANSHLPGARLIKFDVFSTLHFNSQGA